MAAKWGKRGKDAADGAKSERISNKLDAVLVAEAKPKKLQKLRQLPRRRLLLAGGILVLGIAAVVSGVYFATRKDPAPVPQASPQEAKTELMADYYKRLKAAPKQPDITPAGQLKTYEDKIQRGDIGKESSEQFGTYAQAAFLAAQLHKSEQAAEYAKKALTYRNEMSAEEQKLSAGTLKNLEAISKGQDYAAPQRSL